MDVVSFCSELIKCKSVTPCDGGAIDILSQHLLSLGFKTRILAFESSDRKNVVKNLFASYGDSSRKILGFLGHSDVVPAGDGWEVDPFSATQQDGFLIGRGVADMKGGIAAFYCAVERFIQSPFDGTIELFITGDEEVGSYEGAQSLIKWVVENDLIPHDCLVGEPSSDVHLGSRVYLGHRGSMNVVVKSTGQQGHVAYPSNYKNSLSKLCRYIAKISDYQWKYENKKFPRTNIEVTKLFTNNNAVNIVPDLSSANLNIRFNNDYSVEELKNIMQQEADEFPDISFDFLINGEAYYCDSDKLKRAISWAINEGAGITPSFSAAGGTSDGRYMIKYCNVIEFGLQDSTIHQKNEKVKIDDLKKLEKIYLLFLNKYFE